MDTASADDDGFHPEDGTGFRDEEVGGGNHHGDGDLDDDSGSEEGGLVRSDRTDNSRSSKGSNGRRRLRRREQQQPGRQRQRRGGGNGRRGGPRPSSRRNRNGYSSIGGDSSDDDYGYEERSSSSSSSRGMLCTTLFLIISMVVIGIAGLWIYQQDENPFANFDVSGALSNLFGDGSEGSGGSGNGFTNNMDSPHVGDVEDTKKSSSNTSPNYDYNNNNNNQYEKSSSGSSSSTSSSLPSSYSTFDREALNKLLEENHIPTHSSRRPKHKVRYDPTGLLQAVNPFDFTMPNTYGSNVLAPIQFGDGGSSYYEQDYLGYLQHPDIVNGTLVFSAEGDVFVTTLDDYFATEAEEDINNIVMSATKLTTTIGNVLDPKLHPSMRYLAYTGTYSGRRDVYLMDLQGPRTPAMRLTYWEVGAAGVSKVIGWVGNSILFRAVSNTVSLRDTRLYLLNLDDHLFGTIADDDYNDDQGNNNTDNNNPSTVVLGIDPVPFSQANDAVRYQNCWYFVRVKQTSQTIRYVGGTAEDIWKFCDGDEISRRLLSDGYNGTTKSPQIYVNTDDNKEYLLFLSDREKDSTGNNWIPGRMNIWALDKNDPSKTLVKITDTECDFEGRTIQEYTLDDSTGNLIVRIGADLYIQKFDKTRRRLEMAAAAQQEPIRFLKQDNDKKKNDNNKNNNKKNQNQNNNNNKKNQNNNNNNNNNKNQNNNNNKNQNNNNNKNQNNKNNNNGKNTDAPSSAPSASPSASPTSSPSITSTDAEGDDYYYDGETDFTNDGEADNTNADGELFDGEIDSINTTFADGEGDGDGEMDGVNATNADGEDGEGDGEMNQTIASSADGELFDGEIDHSNTTFADGEEGDGEMDGVYATSADGEDGEGDGEMNQTIATSADGEVFDGEADGEEGDGEMGGVNATSADGEDGEGDGEMNQTIATSADGEVFDGEIDGTDTDGEVNSAIDDGSDNETEIGTETDTTFATISPSKLPSASPSSPPSTHPTTSLSSAQSFPDKDDGTDGSDETNGGDEVVEETAESSMDLNETSDLNQTEAEEKISVYYDYAPPEMESRQGEEYVDHHSGTSSDLTRLPIVVHSDFSAHQERLLEVSMIKHLTSADVYDTTVGGTSFIMTLRGQLWVAPVIDDDPPEYEGSGMNMPHRQYRVAPGATMGGVVRVLKALHVPNPVEDETTDRRLALILATDPLSKTAEHAFYLIETQPGSNPVFLDFDNLPRPFLGGHVSGGATKANGLGSVKPTTLTVSPCGRRMAWSDTDGRILVMNMPQYQHLEIQEAANYTVLPTENELGEPMVGDEVELSFSPGGRYLAVSHNSLNQFAIISIVDLGDPIGDDEVADIVIGRIVQATPSRFNSDGMYWGKSTRDSHVLERETTIAEVLGEDAPDDVATTLYFLSDRDIHSDVGSPWGTRQPMPHFDRMRKAVYALPLTPRNATEESEGRFSGGGASELQVDAVLERSEMLTTLEEALAGRRRLSRALNSALVGVYGIADVSYEPKRGTNERVLDSDIDNSTVSDSSNDNSTVRSATFPTDMDIDFGSVDLSFARQAYRLSNIPEGDYYDILCQTNDDGSLVIIAEEGGDTVLKAFFFDPYPSDAVTDKTFEPTIRKLVSYGLSTSRDYFYLGFSPDGAYKVAPNTDLGVASLILDTELDEDVVDSDGLFLSVWPSLEHRQMYSDAWRMLRDYFYDPEMTQIDWPAIHERYLPLVTRCSKREELDDVLAQMASELSALHVFVYGGEYNMPVTDLGLKRANNVASLGATLQRAPEWKGYKIVAIPERDPDFNVIDGGITPIYSPLSDQLLRLSGQKGLKVGDVIVGVNGESVMRVPDIHMLLRGMAGRSVRLDVLRLASGVEKDDGLVDESPDAEIVAEPLITVPLDPGEYDDLLYSAWEYKTQMAAETLAAENDFSVGYVHLRDMSGSAGSFDAFARGFFPNYHKDAFILDVRHNRGGSMDSWVLDILQRQAFYYWEGRDFNPFNGGLGWDEQFAFRGHIVVLIDEKTSSDGEGVSRGISELGLGRLIGMRTWGGGIWLSSDNRLVDGGIASAPEIGTYNDKWGWGMGIEQVGVTPDVEVDNEPYSTYKGSDAQLERAIAELKTWLEEEPVIIPKPPPHKKDMTMGERECTAR